MELRISQIMSMIDCMSNEIFISCQVVKFSFTFS